jgi:hypothetical protein
MIENVSEVAFGIYAVGNCKLSDVVYCAFLEVDLNQLRCEVMMC